MMKKWMILFGFGMGAFHAGSQGNLYKTTTGTLSFTSRAPLEVITASSKKMEGVIDIEALTFAFSVTIRTFEGFNNGLQRQHFYENYMETNKYPKATFAGRIIENIDLSVPGTYTVRTKGILTIHGRSKERIIKVDLVRTGEEIKAVSSFLVPLDDHQIEVPRIVNQKIAREIGVEVKATLTPPGKS